MNPKIIFLIVSIVIIIIAVVVVIVVVNKNTTVSSSIDSPKVVAIAPIIFATSAPITNSPGTNNSSGTGANNSSGTGANNSSGTGANNSSGTGANNSSGTGANNSSGTITSAPTPPITSAPITTPPIPQNLVKIISLERYTDMQLVINELIVYDEQMNKINIGFASVSSTASSSTVTVTGSTVTGSASASASASVSGSRLLESKILVNPLTSTISSTFPNRPANMVDGNFYSGLVTTGVMPNINNYEIYGSAIDSRVQYSGYNPDHIDYINSIQKFVFMKVIGTKLYMVLSDNSQAKSTDAPVNSLAADVFNQSAWDTYTTITTCSVGEKMGKDLIKVNMKYIKIILKTPSKIRRIMIKSGQLDTDFICRTINGSGIELSNVNILLRKTENNLVSNGIIPTYMIDYDVYSGRNIGVSPTNNVLSYAYLKRERANFWYSLGGTLSQAHIIGQSSPEDIIKPMLYGANSAQALFYSFIEIPRWFPMGNGGGTQISVNNRTIALVNSSFDAYYINNGDIVTDRYTKIDNKKVKQVKLDSETNNLYILENGNKEGYYTTTLNANPDWISLSTNTIYLSACNNKVCIISSNNDVFYKSDVLSSSSVWKKIPGKKMKQIDIDRLIIVGLDMDNNVYYTDLYDPDLLSTTPKWVQLPGKFSYISVNDGNLCGITDTGIVFVSVESNRMGYSYKGCFNDMEEPRAIPNSLGNVGSQYTTQQCAKIAQHMGYDTFALQYGDQCFGGNNPEYSKYGIQTDNTKCIMNNPGGYTNIVYQL